MGPSEPLGDRPAVSPYLNLIDNGLNFSGISPYSILVQPLIEQSDRTAQQGAAIRNLQNQYGGGGSSAYQGQRGANGLRSTGHSTRFLNYSHYYTYSSARGQQGQQGPQQMGSPTGRR